MSGYREIDRCRVGGNSHLVSVLDLGMQSLTGVFPTSASEPVGKGPLELVWSPDSGLLQLRHAFEPAEMYGENYGYRSGLNQSMVDHLANKVRQLERLRPPQAGDTVLDIGSNDATLLKAYGAEGQGNRDALVALNALLALPQVVERAEPPGTVPLWHRLADRDTASPKVWMDAYLAWLAKQ